MWQNSCWQLTSLSRYLQHTLFLFMYLCSTGTQATQFSNLQLKNWLCQNLFCPVWTFLETTPSKWNIVFQSCLSGWDRSDLSQSWVPCYSWTWSPLRGPSRTCRKGQESIWKIHIQSPGSNRQFSNFSILAQTIFSQFEQMLNFCNANHVS